MPISAKCPACGHSATMPDSAVGRTARCKCGNRFQVIAPTAQPQPAEFSLELEPSPVAAASNNLVAMRNKALQDKTCPVCNAPWPRVGTQCAQCNWDAISGQHNAKSVFTSRSGASPIETFKSFSVSKKILIAGLALLLLLIVVGLARMIMKSNEGYASPKEATSATTQTAVAATPRTSTPEQKVPETEPYTLRVMTPEQREKIMPLYDKWSSKLEESNPNLSLDQRLAICYAIMMRITQEDKKDFNSRLAEFLTVAHFAPEAIDYIPTVHFSDQENREKILRSLLSRNGASQWPRCLTTFAKVWEEYTLLSQQAEAHGSNLETDVRVVLGLKENAGEAKRRQDEAALDEKRQAEEKLRRSQQEKMEQAERKQQEEVARQREEQSKIEREKQLAEQRQEFQRTTEEKIRQLQQALTAAQQTAQKANDDVKKNESLVRVYEAQLRSIEDRVSKLNAMYPRPSNYDSLNRVYESERKTADSRCSTARNNSGQLEAAAREANLEIESLARELKARRAQITDQ